MTAIIGKIRHAFQTQRLPTAQDCRRMLNGIQQQASLRLGTVHLGLRQQQGPTTRQKAQQNVDTNAKNITVGKTRSALPTLRLQTAPDFHQIQSGTPLQASLKLGMVHLGLRALQEHTTQLQALQNADTNAIHLHTEKIQAVYQIQELPTAPACPQAQSGTLLQALHRLGTDLRGILRRLVLTTQPRVQQSAGTNAEQTTHGTKRI